MRNEDVFVERAVRNAVDFCDRLIIADHYSTDGTFEIVSRLAAEFPEKIELQRITDTRESHFLINGYAGSRTWIFAVDGDEVYDPAGLERLRGEVLSGQYDEWWIVFGNVLNCTAVDPSAGVASGYLAPPCRSMTKLFNFNLIESWDGAVTHVHGQWHDQVQAGLRCFAPIGFAQATVVGRIALSLPAHLLRAAQFAGRRIATGAAQRLRK